jgi:hypothetical protein
MLSATGVATDVPWNRPIRCLPCDQLETKLKAQTIFLPMNSNTVYSPRVAARDELLHLIDVGATRENAAPSTRKADPIHTT